MTTQQIEIYRSALKEARGSFERASAALTNAEREVVRRRVEMSMLRRTITALAAQCSEEPYLDPMGITEACTELMNTVRETVSTQSVVKELEERGFDITSQKNVAASVHAVLSRLAEKGKITKVTTDEGKSVFWQGPNYDPGTEITDDDIPF